MESVCGSGKEYLNVHCVLQEGKKWCLYNVSESGMSSLILGAKMFFFVFVKSGVKTWSLKIRSSMDLKRWRPNVLGSLNTQLNIAFNDNIVLALLVNIWRCAIRILEKPVKMIWGYILHIDEKHFSFSEISLVYYCQF